MGIPALLLWSKGTISDVDGSIQAAVYGHSAGLEARFAAIAGVDEVHRFALACGREELPVAGGGKAQAPEAGPGQLRLRLDHHGQGPVYRLAFDMPAREARELEEVMGVGGLGHLAETQIEPLREEDVQESDPVFAWRVRAQVRERVGETGGGRPPPAGYR